MLDPSSLSQTFNAKLELMEFLPRMQGDGSQTSHTEEGDVTQPMCSLQVPTWGHTRISPVWERAVLSSLCTTESHLTSFACWHIPEFTLTPSWPQNTHTSGSPVLCVVSAIFKIIQILQLQMTIVITVSNSVAINNSWQVLHTPEPRNVSEQSYKWDKLLNCINSRKLSWQKGNKTQMATAISDVTVHPCPKPLCAMASTYNDSLYIYQIPLSGWAWLSSRRSGHSGRLANWHVLLLVGEMESQDTQSTMNQHS